MNNNIKLLQGDCLKLMDNIPDKSIDLILCDMPYGTTNLDFDKQPICLAELWEQYNRIIKDNAAVLLFSAQPFTTDLICSNRKMFRYEIIWKKTLASGFLNANKMPMKAHENICVFYKHLPVYHPQMCVLSKEEIKQKGVKIGRERVKRNGICKQYKKFRKGSYIEKGTRYPNDVIEFSNWNGVIYGNTENATRHPTQKPVPLLEYLINTYSNEQDIVLDNCMGSGSTGVACVNTKRKFIGMEIDKKYFDIAKQRIENSLKDVLLQKEVIPCQKE